MKQQSLQTSSSRAMKHRGPLLALTLGLLSATAQAQSAAGNTIAFASVNLAGDQNARVTLTNLSEPPEPNRSQTPDGVCQTSVQFFDAEGVALGEPQVFDLKPGTSALASAPMPASSEATSATGLYQARATVRLSKPVLKSYEAWPCRSTVAAFEVYDSVSGGTRFINPGVIRGFNPQPDPPKD